MEFIESHIFEKQVNKLLSDDEFAMFQGFLFSNPKAGAVMKAPLGCSRQGNLVHAPCSIKPVRVI